MCIVFWGVSNVNGWLLAVGDDVLSREIFGVVAVAAAAVKLLGD